MGFGQALLAHGAQRNSDKPCGELHCFNVSENAVARIRAYGEHVVINYEGSTLILKTTDLDDLSSTDFV